MCRKMPFAQRNDPMQAFVFDGTHEPLRVRVAVRCLHWCLNDPHANRTHAFTHGPAPLSIAIANEHRAVRLCLPEIPYMLQPLRLRARSSRLEIVASVLVAL